MAVVKLPSGKTVKVPDGMTKSQSIEYIFDKLDGVKGYEEDRKKLGDQLDTSGWGATIGGTLGSIGGAIGGVFTSPSLVVNPITLGAAGGAAGSALGEGLEQWWTGKGDYADIGKAGAVGGALGGIGGGTAGAIAKGGAKAAATLGAGAGAIEGGRQGGISGAVTGAVAGGATGGLLGGPGSKLLSVASQKLGLDKPVKSAIEIGKTAVKGYANAQWLKLTGRGTAGALQQSAVGWQFRRDVANKIFKESKKVFEKDAGRRAKPLELKNLREASKLEAEDLYDYQLGIGKTTNKLEPTVTKPKAKWDPKTKKHYFEDEVGNRFDAATKEQLGKSYAQGGRVKGLLG